VTEAYVLALAQNALAIALMIAAPVLVVSLVVGIIISLIQAATQINEATLSFVPKLIGVSAVLLILGSWMLQQMLTFTRALFESLPTLVK
jgi:flagellar biosynthesis protein FliQ